MSFNQFALLVDLKNAILLKKNFFISGYNFSKIQLLKFLYKEGLIQSFFVIDKSIFIYFRNFLGICNFESIVLMYKPSFSYSLVYKDILRINSKQRIIAISTNLGFLTSFDCKKKKLGGKILFII